MSSKAYRNAFLALLLLYAVAAVLFLLVRQAQADECNPNLVSARTPLCRLYKPQERQCRPDVDLDLNFDILDALCACPDGQCLQGIEPETGEPICVPCGCSGGSNLTCPFACDPDNCVTGFDADCGPICSPCVGATSTTTSTTVVTTTTTTSSTTTTTLPPGYKCYNRAGVAATDDHVSFWDAPPSGATITGVTCRCEGDCTGPIATFILEDCANNVISMASTLTCVVGSGVVTPVAPNGGDADRILTAGECLRFSVSNSPATNDTVRLCFMYN